MSFLINICFSSILKHPDGYILVIIDLLVSMTDDIVFGVGVGNQVGPT